MDDAALQARLDAIEQAGSKVTAAMGKVRGVAEQPNLYRIEVDSRGRLTDLQLSQPASALPPRQLAGALMRAYQGACADVDRQTAAYLKQLNSFLDRRVD